MKTAILAALLVVATAAQSAEPAACANIRALIVDGEQRIAQRTAEGILDDSAPRATMRAADKTAILSEISIEIQMLTSAGCAVPLTTFSGDRFLNAAVQCDVKLRGISRSDRTLPPECDRETWKREVK